MVVVPQGRGVRSLCIGTVGLSAAWARQLQSYLGGSRTVSRLGRISLCAPWWEKLVEVQYQSRRECGGLIED